MTVLSRHLGFLASVAALVSALPHPAADAPLETRQGDSHHSGGGLYVPFYGTSANGFSAPPRGWNSFAYDTVKAVNKGWKNDDQHYRDMCGRIPAQPGVDNVCSLDSGWSIGGNGNDDGLIVNDPNVIPNMKDLADFLHGKGLKFGIYLLPGAFSADKDKKIPGTQTTLGSVFSNEPEYNVRRNFDYSKPDVQKWHDAQVKWLIDNGVDFIKLDYVTPGSPDGGPPNVNNSGGVAAYHKAIENNQAQGKMRLDISWKLDRSDPYWGIWQSSADSLRIDQDTNNGQDAKSLTNWGSVLRTLDYYRQFINEQTQEARQGKPIMIRPDMDNTFIGNAEKVSGLTNAQRYTQAALWIGAGANLITGSDLTQIDDLGKELLYNDEAQSVAAFTAQYPMQPRNPNDPHGYGTPGANAALQCQTWIAGPAPNGTAVVWLSNLGPDPCRNGGCQKTHGLDWKGDRNVSITFHDLGIGDSNKYNVHRVWGGGGRGGSDHAAEYQATDRLESWLGEGETAMYVLNKA